MKRTDGTLTDAQLRAELERCEYCEEKPCLAACPAGCSPADFIMATRVGRASDYRRAASLILGANPLGWVCGAVCPDYFCMEACSRCTFDRPINIPAIQATIVKRATAAGLKHFPAAQANGKKVAVVGAGPAGLSAAAVLAQWGYSVTIHEQRPRPGGMLNLIPGYRLESRVVRKDIAFIKGLGKIRFKRGKTMLAPERLLEDHDAVIVAAGLGEPTSLNVPGATLGVSWQHFLEQPNALRISGQRVAVLGGGAVAVDCAVSARERGARHVELIYRRKQEHMPLTAYERGLLLKHGIEISSCCKVLEIVHKRKRVEGLWLVRMMLPKGQKPRPENFVVLKREPPFFREFDLVISAIGGHSKLPLKKMAGVFYAGDMVGGSGTVVEAVASGKQAALQADEFVRLLHRGGDGSSPHDALSDRVGTSRPHPDAAAARVLLAGANPIPVPLEAEFFGRKIRSPFLLSAAPHTDGYAQMQTAYERGWSGGIIKTAFDNVPIHIPGGYMTVLGPSTYGNCDNVSGHTLDRVCREVSRLVKEFPDRLTLASTGGPVTSRDEEDKAAWQANTRRLESSGVMGIEYSLSCPQGGDGTNGDMVSQNAELAAKVIDWVMEASDASNPKLFKLTAAVTAIGPLLKKIQAVFAKYPQKKAGITLANSFPGMTFRGNGQTPAGRRWESGVVVGISGEGVLPISNLTLAGAASSGIVISGNGGAMNYLAAANFLALGARTVQFCTVVMKHGLGIIDELHSGLSHLLQERGFKSVEELIGSAWPSPIADFLSLSAIKKIPQVAPERCRHCGNCTRCPYQAITLDAQGTPEFAAENCVGCSLCAQKCFAGALVMRERTQEEQSRGEAVLAAPYPHLRR